MSCTTVSVSGGTLLYGFDLYEVDFSSLWTLMPDAPDTNFPLITFNNKTDGTIPVFGAQTGATLESIYHPSFTNGMQLIDPDLEDFNVKILTSTPSTLSYLVAGLANVFDTSAEISSQITYGIDLVISASQQPAVELERAWDEAWERGLINPTASVLYSYFTLMGLTYEMDIRRSEGANLPAFEAWLSEQEVPSDIQASLLALDAQLTSGNSEDWKTEYNYTNEGFEPYQITSVFFGIQNLKVDPNWSCDNPYDLPEPWTKYRDTERPRLDALRAYGRLIIPDKIIKVREGSYSITAADLSGSNVLTLEVPYGFDVTDFVKAPYGDAFSPSLYKTVVYPTPDPISEINEDDYYDDPYDLNAGEFTLSIPATVVFGPGPDGFAYDTCDVIGGGDPNPYNTESTTLTLPRGDSVVGLYVKDTDAGFINIHFYRPGTIEGMGVFALSIDLALGESGSNHDQSLLQTATNTRLVYNGLDIEDIGDGWKKIFVHVTTEIDDVMATSATFDARIALCATLTPSWTNFSGPGVGIDGQYVMDNEYDFTFGMRHIQFSSLFVLEIIVTQPATPDPYIPLISEPNWAIDTLVSSNLWEFDNTHFGPTDAFDDYFTMRIRVPLKLKTALMVDPSLGSEVVTINWTAKFIAVTEYIYPMLETAFFDPLYASCGQGGGEKVKYIKGTGIIFDVQSFANGLVTLHGNINSCKTDILDIYDNYYEYAANFSKVASYGDLINFHGRFIDAHGAEFFTTTKQVLRPQEYILGDNEDLEIINLNAIVIADEAKECAAGQVYNADTLSIPCSSSNDIFQTNQVPAQKSTTSVSLSSKLTKINGKICPVLPPNITPKT